MNKRNDNIRLTTLTHASLSIGHGRTREQWKETTRRPFRPYMRTTRIPDYGVQSRELCYVQIKQNCIAAIADGCIDPITNFMTDLIIISSVADALLPLRMAALTTFFLTDLIIIPSVADALLPLRLAALTTFFLTDMIIISSVADALLPLP